MTSIRTYVTILLQDLLAWLHQKLSRWLLGDVNARLHKIEITPAYGIEALDRIAALEKQFVANRTSIATAFASEHERLCALEDNAQKAKATAHGTALEFVEVKNRIEFLEKAPVKAPLASATLAKPAAKRKSSKR